MRGGIGAKRDARTGMRAGVLNYQPNTIEVHSLVPLYCMLWDVTPPPNNENAMGTRRPVQKKKKNKTHCVSYFI